jgi:hypothetical protein
VESVSGVKFYSAREAGQELGMRHLEVIRRIRKGQINADRMGWFYIITGEELARIKDQEWYKRLQARAQ